MLSLMVIFVGNGIDDWHLNHVCFSFHANILGKSVDSSVLLPNMNR